MYGIAGFVEGFTGGVDKAHQWKDRKADRKRQERLDALGEEEHTRRMSLLDQQIAANEDAARARKKAFEDQAFYESTYQGAVDATKESMGRGLEGTGPGPAGAPSDVTATTPGNTSGLPPPSGILPLGVPQGPDSRPNVAPPGMPTPEELTRRYGAQGSAPGVVNAPTVSGPAGGPAPAAAPVAAAAPAAAQPPVPLAGGPVTPAGGPVPAERSAGGLIRLPDGTMIAPAPRGIIADELAADGQGTGVRYLPAPNGLSPAEQAAEKARLEAAKVTAPADDTGRAAMEAANKKAEDQAVQDFIDLPATRKKAADDAKNAELNSEIARLNAVATGDGPIPLEWRKEAAADLATAKGDKLAMAAEADAMANRSPRASSLTAPYKGDAKARAAAAGTAAPTGKAPASAPPEVKAMADTAATAMAETTTPAMQAASEAAARGLPEMKPGEVPTEAKRKKYADSFMDHYREVGAPMVYEALVSKGEFAKAEAFREFMDKDATKAGMENWAKAAFAASVGDMDTFATEIMDAYDRLDYFPDGTTIVREESGFTKDKAGNITGAKLTFRDAQTGNTWDQVFTDPNDMVRMGITLLAPEEAFEYYFEEQQAASEAARGLQTKEAERADEEAKATERRIDEVAKMIYEASVGIDGKPTMTYGQAREQAKTEVLGPTEGAAPGAPGGPPVARRPD